MREQSSSDWEDSFMEEPRDLVSHFDIPFLYTRPFTQPIHMKPSSQVQCHCQFLSLLSFPLIGTLISQQQLFVKPSYVISFPQDFLMISHPKLVARFPSVLRISA